MVKDVQKQVLCVLLIFHWFGISIRDTINSLSFLSPLHDVVGVQLRGGVHVGDNVDGNL